MKRGLTADAAQAALPGHRFSDARRRGKLLLLDTDDDGPTLGLHLGMSGRVVIDDEAAGDPLLYASNGDNPVWRRFGVTFADGGSLYLRDPRRLGAAELDPDEDRLGIDAFSVKLADVRTHPHEEQGAGEGRAHGPVPHRRAREPAHRRGPVPRRRRPGPSGEHTGRRRGPASRPRHLDDGADPAAAGRLAHRRPHAGPGAGRSLPRATAPSCCDAPWADGPPTPARCTSVDGPDRRSANGMPCAILGARAMMRVP